MSNRLRTEIQEEETEKELIVKETPVKDNPESFSLSSLLSKGLLTTDSVTGALPFLFYLAFLGMVYIGNRHLAENNIRNIDKVSKEVKELSWDFKTTKADLAYKSTLTEVAKRADTLGVTESVEPPQKLIDGEVKP